MKFIVSTSPDRDTFVSPDVRCTRKRARHILFGYIEVCIAQIFFRLPTSSFDHNILGIVASCMLVVSYREGYLVLNGAND